MIKDPLIDAARHEFELGALNESDVTGGPVEQFRRWFDAAHAAEVRGIDEMVLATADSHGRPSARVVLLKGIEDDLGGGLVFVTNYGSRKGAEIGGNPFAAVCVWWHEMERQIRWEGRVEKASLALSEAIFRKRPRGAQLGAWASKQSSVISSREALEAQVAETERRFEGGEVPLPENWGAYVVRPERVEFWQGRKSRLHDRLEYVLASSGGWSVRRLSP